MAGAVAGIRTQMGSSPYLASVTYMAHRPNEFVTKEQYLKGIKLFVTICNDYAS